MPKMIPDEAPSRHNEEAILNNLVINPHAQNWTVFHSELVEDSVKFGGPCEIDFVILIPEYYTVICLEVKDGSFEIDENNQWWRTNYPRKLVPSPIKQAQNASAALKQFKPSYFGPLTLGYAVAVSGTFSSAAGLPEGTLIIDNRDILGDPLVEKLNNYACRIRKKLGAPENPIDAHTALSDLGEALQNKLENADMPEKRDIIRYNLATYREEFLRLTDDQGAILKQVKENDRGVIFGAAGTGKTILAMKLAEELSEHGKKKVALLCSNTYLSRRLEKWAENLDGVEAGTPLTLPAKVPSLRENYRNIPSRYPTLEESLNPEYIDAEWGTFIRDIISVLEEEEEYFDYLIVDEAQNLYGEVFLKLMNALLKDGLANGKWRLFGDFENQNIVDLQFSGDWKEILEESLESQEVRIPPPYFKLETNCRSTQEIAKAFSIFLDDDNDLPSPMNGVHGPDFEIKYFQSTQDILEEGEDIPTLEELMDDLVSDFKERGFSSEQMVLLFTGDRNKLGIDTQRKYGDCALLDIRDVKESLTEAERVIVTSSSPSNKLRYSDVYDFQGLESELVFLVLSVTEDMMVAGGGVAIPHEGYMERLLYTGMSRAKTMLVIVADKSYEELIEELILWSKKENLQSSGDSGDSGDVH